MEDIDAVNIFYTNDDPIIAAHEHCKTHMIKMITEYSQLLCTCHRLVDSDKKFWHDLMRLYKPNHMNHPSALWLRVSSQHYIWLVTCLKELHKMYTAYSGKEHASYRLIRHISEPPQFLEDKGFLPAFLAINRNTYPHIHEKFDNREIDTTRAYQLFQFEKMYEWTVREDKRKIFPEWTYLEKPPYWWNDLLTEKVNTIVKKEK